MSIELAVVWLVTGLVLSPLSFGLTFAYFQREFPSLAEQDYGTDRRRALVTAVLTIVCPPVVLATLILGGTKHGLKFR